MPIAHIRRHFAEIDSTNTYALHWPHAPHGALVWADSQTAGRGRLGRSWSSPAGKGLYFSLVTRDLAPEVRSRLSLLIGLGVSVAVETLSGISTQIKWPNDVLARGQKIGGILCEGTSERLVAGVGLNLNQLSAELPERPIFPASSLLLLTGRSFDAGEALDCVIAALDEVLEDDNWANQRAQIEARLFGLNEVARIGGVVGSLRGVGDDGCLLLHTADGMREMRSGELEFF